MREDAQLFSPDADDQIATLTQELSEAVVVVEGAVEEVENVVEEASIEAGAAEASVSEVTAEALVVEVTEVLAEAEKMVKTVGEEGTEERAEEVESVESIEMEKANIVEAAIALSSADTAAESIEATTEPDGISLENTTSSGYELAAKIHPQDCEYDLDDDEEEEGDNLDAENGDRATESNVHTMNETGAEGVLVSEVSPEELSLLSKRIPGLVSGSGQAVSGLVNSGQVIPGKSNRIPSIIIEEDTIFEDCSFVSETEQMKQTPESGEINTGDTDTGDTDATGRYEPIESPLSELYEGVGGYDGMKHKSDQSSIYESVQIQSTTTTTTETMSYPTNTTKEAKNVEENVTSAETSAAATSQVASSDSETEHFEISTDQKTWSMPEGYEPPTRPKRASGNEYDNVPLEDMGEVLLQQQEEEEKQPQKQEQEQEIAASTDSIVKSESSDASSRRPSRYNRRATSSLSERPGLNLGYDRMEIDVESEEEDEDEEDEERDLDGAVLTSQRPRGKLVRSVGGSFAEEEIVGSKAKLDQDAASVKDAADDDVEGVEGSTLTSQRPRGRLERGIGGSFPDEQFEVMNKMQVVLAPQDEEGEGISVSDDVSITTTEHFEDLQPYEALSSVGSGSVTDQGVSDYESVGAERDEISFKDAATDYDAVTASVDQQPTEKVQETTPEYTKLLKKGERGMKDPADVTVYDTVPVESLVSGDNLTVPEEDSSFEKKSEAYMDVVVIENENEIPSDEGNYENVSILSAPVSEDLKSVDGEKTEEVADTSTVAPETREEELQDDSSGTKAAEAHVEFDESTAVPEIIDDVSNASEEFQQPLQSEAESLLAATSTSSNENDSKSQQTPIVNVELCEEVQSVSSEFQEAPPSPGISLLSVSERQMRKYSSSALIASEEEEEAKAFESHFETMSEEAESILKAEPVADIMKNLDARLTPRLTQKYAAKNKSTASSLASEEEAEATIFEGHFETVAEEATNILESDKVAPIVAELHEKVVERREASIGRSLDREQVFESDGSTQELEEKNDGLLETLKSIESEASESEDLLDATEEMDTWRPRGMERRRGEELPTPFLVRKRRKESEMLETEVSEFEEHERRLVQLSSNIDKILAPLAANEMLDDDEDLLRVAISAPLAKFESLHSLCSEVASSREEICVIEIDEEETIDHPHQLSFCSRLCSWFPWRRSSEAAPSSWFAPFRFLTAAAS